MLEGVTHLIDKGDLLRKRRKRDYRIVRDTFFDVLFIQHADSRGRFVDNGGRLSAMVEVRAARFVCLLSQLSLGENGKQREGRNTSMNYSRNLVGHLRMEAEGGFLPTPAWVV